MKRASQSPVANLTTKGMRLHQAERRPHATFSMLQMASVISSVSPYAGDNDSLARSKEQAIVLLPTASNVFVEYEGWVLDSLIHPRVNWTHLEPSIRTDQKVCELEVAVHNLYNGVEMPPKNDTIDNSTRTKSTGRPWKLPNIHVANICCVPSEIIFDSKQVCRIRSSHMS